MRSEQQQGGRPLEYSDIVSGKHAAILADPYGFLGLPQDAPFDVVRGVYIAKAKLFHPDMIDPKIPSVEAMNARLMESGRSLHDLLGKPSALGPEATEEEKEREMKERFAELAGVTVEDLDHQQNALTVMQELAHTRMVEVNTAYEAIRLKLNPKEREMLAGYRIVDRVEEPDEFRRYRRPYQEIDLEGQAQVHILPTGRQDVDQEYTIPGAYLLFDWAPPRDHRWMTWEMDYAESEFLKHLFVNYELQQGRKRITPALLEPFYATFGLDRSQRELFERMLVGRRRTEEILDAIGMRQVKDTEALTSEWRGSLRFEQAVNGMKYLYPWEPDWHIHDLPTIKIEDGKIKLKAYTETVLSESDTILLQTIAYGPMLRGE